MYGDGWRGKGSAVASSRRIGGRALCPLRMTAIPRAVTGASTRLGFDPRGQTAKTARIDEPAALVISNK